MELHRLEAICEAIRAGLERHGADPAALAAHIREQHITRVDIAEALEDVGRLPSEQAEASAALLRRALSL